MGGVPDIKDLAALGLIVTCVNSACRQRRWIDKPQEFQRCPITRLAGLRHDEGIHVIRGRCLMVGVACMAERAPARRRGTGMPGNMDSILHGQRRSSHSRKLLNSNSPDWFSLGFSCDENHLIQNQRLFVAAPESTRLAPAKSRAFSISDGLSDSSACGAFDEAPFGGRSQ